MEGVINLTGSTLWVRDPGTTGSADRGEGSNQEQGTILAVFLNHHRAPKSARDGDAVIAVTAATSLLPLNVPVYIGK